MVIPGDPDPSLALYYPFAPCSCVALMDLQKMRAAGWGGGFVAAAVSAHLAHVNPSEAFPYGDQDIVRIVQRHYPGRCFLAAADCVLLLESTNF